MPKIWTGSQKDYDNLQEKEKDVTYLIEDTVCLPYSPLESRTIQDVLNDFTINSKPKTVLYTCDYCGTDYNAEIGFVPPCRNCGARLRRVG